MSDLIDRQMAINEIMALIEEPDDDFNEGVRNSAVVIYQLPSAQPQWIPVTERLPKYPFRVQIQLDNGWIITGYYSEEHWYTVPYCGGFLRNDEVEAWRELPEPYGGESDV